jgi:hypothetical protein
MNDRSIRWFHANTAVVVLAYAETVSRPHQDRR